jgi:hypothetical protein
MTPVELDQAYTQLCNTMTELGEEQATLFLARFAMLALLHIDDAQATHRLITQAAGTGAP